MTTEAVAYRDGVRVPGPLALTDAFEAGRGEGAFVWVQVVRPTDGDLVEVADEFGLHPLAVEDALRSHQRTKLEWYGSTLFMVAKAVDFDEELGLQLTEVHLFVGAGFIVSAVHGSGGFLTEVSDQLEQQRARLLAGPGAVLHALLDHIADDYLAVTAQLEERVDQTETLVFSAPARSNPNEAIFRLKRDVMAMRRAIDPLIDALDPLVRGHVPDGCSAPELAIEFRDVQDHVHRALTRLDGARDVLTAAFEARLSQISVRQNEDMRAISGWAAVIAVPTLLAGVWGMNFENMPELHSRLGYPIAISTLILSALTVYAILKKNNWL